MKIGDKVKCIKQDSGIRVGTNYVITKVGSYDNKLTVWVEGSVCEYYVDQFELINTPLSMEEQIKLAKSYIGKTIMNAGWVVEKVNVVLFKDEASRLKIASGWVCDDIDENGFSVVVSNDGYAYPVMMAVIGPDSLTVKLNDNYSAKVFKDKLVVGCQTFPSSILYDLVEAHKSLL